jgi:hypothetical protein
VEDIVNPWWRVQLVAIGPYHLSHGELGILGVELLRWSVRTNILQVEPDLVFNLEVVRLLSSSVGGLLLTLLSYRH